LASAQWLKGLGGKKQQSKEMEDWHWRTGSMASAIKSNHQKRQIEGWAGLSTYQRHKLQSKVWGGNCPDWLASALITPKQ
jgi:hypothetical protein